MSSSVYRRPVSALSGCLIIFKRTRRIVAHILAGSGRGLCATSGSNVCFPRLFLPLVGRKRRCLSTSSKPESKEGQGRMAKAQAQAETRMVQSATTA